MNSVISDTAEYGCYLYDQACKPLLGDFMSKIDVDGESLRVRLRPVPPRALGWPTLTTAAANTAATARTHFNRASPHFATPPCAAVIGTKYNAGGYNGVDNRQLNAVNEAIRSHPVEVVGKKLRGYMTAMEKISVGGQ
jgi:ketol-acid reductoisomerase